MKPEEREALREHVLATGMAGDTRTPRDNCVRNARLLAAGDPDKALGIGPRGKSADEIMQAVADLCGCAPSCEIVDGAGEIDPDRTLDELEAMGERLAGLAERPGTTVLIATGHPTGLVTMYQGIARALAVEGVRVLTPLENIPLEPPKKFRRKRAVRYLDGVGALQAGADLIHTHESWPMDQLLDAVGHVDLVLGDHGWAGAAIARGVETLCFADVNDPALAVAKVDRLVDVVVPLDDNLPPSRYDPLRNYLVSRVTWSD